jgi:predicted  nucleic acid-binding Zn-ribbon protein
MPTDLENLMQLQAADREIRRLQEEIAALPKRVAAIEQKLAGTKAALETARAAVKADEAARRKFESANQDLQGKISKYRDQSLAVKTNEQYKALLEEIRFAEQEIRANEDKMLELMLDSDNKEKQVKEAEAELKAETAEIEKEKADAKERTAQDEKELAESTARRESARTGIDPDLLRHYERVQKFRGSGLAEVLNGRCMGCQVALRPQSLNEVRTGKLLVCESCQRILYYDPAHEPVSAEPIVAPSHQRKRARPKIDSPQAWFYRPAQGDTEEILLCFINANGMATRRAYDFSTGRELGDIISREGPYRQAFPEDFRDVVRLNGAWDEEEVDSWGTEMPSTVLDFLHGDLQASHAESAKSSHAHSQHATEGQQV